MIDRLKSLKDHIKMQKDRQFIWMRRNDGDWMVAEIERLRKESLEEDMLLKQGKFEVREHE
jgi:hypothetical protein